MKNQEKLVVITGANSGVGLEVAKTFSKHSYRLLLLDLNTDTIEALQFAHAICRKVDITDYQSFHETVNEAESQYGPVDCLINNAGILYMNDFENQDPIQWKRMMDVNVIGVLNGIKAVTERMVKRNCGTIINMGSLGGHKLIQGQTVYCGSKHAVHGITEGLRMELSGSNVRVSIIAPGAIETNLLSNSKGIKYAEGQDKWAEEIGGILKPSDIATTMLFIYQQPQNVCIREVVLGPTRQEL